MSGLMEGGATALKGDISDDEYRSLLDGAGTAVAPPLHSLVLLPMEASTSATWSLPVRAVCLGATAVYLKKAIPASQAITADERRRARSVVNEQVTGRLGKLMGAPVAETVLVEVNAKTTQQAGCAVPLGVHHGSIKVGDIGRTCREPGTWRKMAPIENRPRFARLAMLYGWVYCTYDHQVAFEKGDPRIVWSFDHGFTIGRGRIPLTRAGDPDWTRADLSNRTIAAVDNVFGKAFQFSVSDLRQAVAPLATIGPEEIASAVAAVPAEWYCSPDERIALCRYLVIRRKRLLERYS